MSLYYFDYSFNIDKMNNFKCNNKNCFLKHIFHSLFNKSFSVKHLLKPSGKGISEKFIC